MHGHDHNVMTQITDSIFVVFLSAQHEDNGIPKHSVVYLQ